MKGAVPETVTEKLAFEPTFTTRFVGLARKNGGAITPRVPGLLNTPPGRAALVAKHRYCPASFVCTFTMVKVDMPLVMSAKGAMGVTKPFLHCSQSGALPETNVVKVTLEPTTAVMLVGAWINTGGSVTARAAS